MPIDLRPGDRVRVAKEWAAPNQPVGTVKETLGAWIAVRFDGHIDTTICMARELESAE